MLNTSRKAISNVGAAGPIVIKTVSWKDPFFLDFANVPNMIVLVIMSACLIHPHMTAFIFLLSLPVVSSCFPVRFTPPFSILYFTIIIAGSAKRKLTCFIFHSLIRFIRQGSDFGSVMLWQLSYFSLLG